jgi:glutaconate CoA-transferase subunit A
MTSYLLARRTHAPGLTLITTSGGYVDVAPRPMLLGLGEALDYKSAAQHASGDGTYHRYYQSGRITHETVATAQVDRFGRTNTIQVRSPSGRIVRLPGQGGMADVSNMHQHFLLYVPRHSSLSLVENVDVSSAARALLTDEERLAAGLRPGVVKVVTNLCVFELDHATRQLQLVALHPGVEIADVERDTGFDVIRSPSLDRTPPPTESELELLATEIDPLGIRHLEFVPARERGTYLAEVIAAEERLVLELAGREA